MGATQQRTGKQILQNVDAEKRDKYTRKLKELRGREWNRDTFVEHTHDVFNVVETVDELITQVQAEKEQASVDDRKAAIKEDVGQEYWEKIHAKTVKGGYRLTFKAIDDQRQTVRQLEKREKEWKAYQYELMKLPAQKLLAVATNYKDDLNSGQVVENVMEFVENRLEDKLDAREQKLMRTLEQRLHQLERQLPADDGPVVEPDEDSAELTVADDAPDYDFSGKSPEEKKQVFQRIIADDDLETWTEVAAEVGVSERQLRNYRNEVEEETGFKPEL